jgi:hypothetical protein
MLQNFGTLPGKNIGQRKEICEETGIDYSRNM